MFLEELHDQGRGLFEKGVVARMNAGHHRIAGGRHILGAELGVSPGPTFTAAVDHAQPVALVEQRLQAAPQLQGVRPEKVPAGSFIPLKQREAERARRLGRRARPPSLLLYPLMLLRKALGWSTWQPFARPDEPALTWAARMQQSQR